MPPGKKAPAKKKNGYVMPPPMPVGEVITDTIGKKKWRLGPSIGVGGFGEVYSACNDSDPPKNKADYPYVIKIEPQENGPLFVEMHFYLRNGNPAEIKKYMQGKKLSSLGMPACYGHGTHEHKGEKYRYLVIDRYGRNLSGIFEDNGKSFPTTTVFLIGLQMLDVLEYIQGQGYIHADIKGANILLGLKKGTENQTYLVDFGLAARVSDKDFKPDPRCAHNGTIEYTSRDAHLGEPTMRGDLEILGYNMLHWLTGELPWEKHIKQPKTVQKMKEAFMDDARAQIQKLYNNVPDALIKFFEYVNTLAPKEKPNFAKCRQIFEAYLKSQGKTKTSKLEFSPQKKTSTNKVTFADEQDGKSEKADDGLKNGRKPRGRAKATTSKPKVVESSSEPENSENEAPKVEKDVKKVKRRVKRKSSEPVALTEVKKTKLQEATPPAKQNHAHISTQTSVERPRPRASPRVAQSPKVNSDTASTSPDIFADDSFTSEPKKKPKRKLLSEKQVTVTKTVRKKTTVAKAKGKSWKDSPAIVNGRSPPN